LKFISLVRGIMFLLCFEAYAFRIRQNDDRRGAASVIGQTSRYRSRGWRCPPRIRGRAAPPGDESCLWGWPGKWHFSEVIPPRRYLLLKHQELRPWIAQRVSFLLALLDTMHDAWLPLKDAVRLSYVITNCILPEVWSTVNWFALRQAIPNGLCWLKMLIRQDTSPFGLCLTSGLQWRLVIQDFFGARHVARLPNWQTCWQAG